MDKWNERLFDNLSRLIANERNERKSKAASVSPVLSPNRIPIAVSYAGVTRLVTGAGSKAASAGSKAASSGTGTEGKITERIEGNKRVGYREDGSIAWSMKTRLKTEQMSPATELRSLMFNFDQE